MTTPRFDPAGLIFRTFAGSALISVAALTLVNDGAMRMYGTPWNGLLWLAQLGPAIALLVRVTVGQREFRLPSPGWCWLAAAGAVVTITCAVLSPYRGPSVIAALTPLAAIATFLLIHDYWSRENPLAESRLLAAGGGFSLAIIAISLAGWVITDWRHLEVLRPYSLLWEHHNAQPLGRSAYTAGLALLTLPWVAAAALRSDRGWSRAGWALVTGLGLVMLFSTGSRGGLLGFAALVLLSLGQLRLGWKRLLLYSSVVGVIVATVAYAYPRTRQILFSKQTVATTTTRLPGPRSVSWAAGIKMGRARPMIGWGPGTTALVYTRFRAQLESGPENEVQLYSTPLQLWADFGGVGLLCAGGFLALVMRRPRDPAREGAYPLRTMAGLSLASYLAFALTDYQLDVPVFAFAVAGLAALIAGSGQVIRSVTQRRLIGLGVVVALGIIGMFGRQDPTPAMNVSALSLGRNSASSDRAIALLDQSLALNPAQEIAQFNLGWLLLTRNPARAEGHLLAAAHLVPDERGVYLGLGLSRLNQTHREAAAIRALALECLNDPLFLTSPWWREPALAPIRVACLAELTRLAEFAREQLEVRNDRRAREAAYLISLAAWIDGKPELGEILARSLTSERVSYFAARPATPSFATTPVRVVRRERKEYPLLMWNADLPAPVDLFARRDNILAVDALRFLFPPKGWLPSPLLVQLLDQSSPAK